MPAEEHVTVYGGEGLPASITTTVRTEELVGEGPQTNITSTSEVVYYLRSSALGAVIAELNSQGTRVKEYVYAGGQRIAEWEITPFNDAIQWQHRNPTTGSWISISAGLNSATRTEVDPSGRTTGNEPFVILENPPEPVPNRRQDAYLIEGGQTIEAELGMQLYEDRYINEVFGPGAGPKQGNYSGEAWRDWQTAREFQLMTGQRFLFGIDKMNAEIAGTYERVDQEEKWYDDDREHRWEVNRYYYRLVPSRGPYPARTGRVGPQEPAKPSHSKEDPCATPNSIVEMFKSGFEELWDQTVKSGSRTREGEENGVAIFYESSTNTYPEVKFSQGYHFVSKRFGNISGPQMPKAREELRRGISAFQVAKRSVVLLAIFHTHPNFIGGDHRLAEPTEDDEGFLKDFGSPLGIIRNGKGYGFFINGKKFGPNDARANECIWDLMHPK